jgi:hypothetical protein
MTEPIRPIGSDTPGVAPVVRAPLLTPIEREEQRRAREEARKRRRRAAPQQPPDEPGHVDVRG